MDAFPWECPDVSPGSFPLRAEDSDSWDVECSALDDEPSAAELAAVEAWTSLEEWDRLRVRDYWEAVIAEELGATMSNASQYRWESPCSCGQLHPVRRKGQPTVGPGLRLVHSNGQAPTPSSIDEFASGSSGVAA